MLTVKGYIDGNTVVSIDDDLRHFDGNEILIHEERLILIANCDSNLPLGF